MYTYNMLHMLVDHRCWPYFEYHAFQREIAQHADNWCSDWATLERLAKEENERQEAAGEFCWAFLARVPAEAVARWGCDIPDNMVALAGGNQGPHCFGRADGWRTTFSRRLGAVVD